jgi:hypothetical protein
MKFRPSSAEPGGATIDVPGPGSYNPNLSSIKTNTPGSKIGTGNRSGLGEKHSGLMPGPGHFNPNDKFSSASKGFGFGSSQRGKVAVGREDGPGPGNY